MGADEPYVVFFIADISESLNPLAKTLISRAKVFEDTEEGKTKYQSLLLWGLNGKPAPMANPDNVIILAAVVENDESRIDTVTSIVQTKLFANLTAYNNPDRATLVKKLIKDMHHAIALGEMACGVRGVTLWLSQLGINQDERVGKPKELRLTWDDVMNAHNNIWVPKVLEIKGDGCHYRLHFGFDKG